MRHKYVAHRRFADYVDWSLDFLKWTLIADSKVGMFFFQVRQNVSFSKQVTTRFADISCQDVIVS